MLSKIVVGWHLPCGTLLSGRSAERADSCRRDDQASDMPPPPVPVRPVPIKAAALPRYASSLRSRYTTM